MSTSPRPDGAAAEGTGASVHQVLERLATLPPVEASRLGRALEGVRRTRDPRRRRAAIARVLREADQVERRRERRRGNVPPLHFPAALPVTEQRQVLTAAIREHQVVVVVGETGSGKTTQLPKICLDLGRGVDGLIGHTQPRRIAARAVAERLSEELDRPLGSVVGYQVRFTDTTSDESLIKVMTDGILLAEIGADRLLSRYDTLIIDEAHERSLTIDFLLGYLATLLPQRPDLKVVITSATIDPQRFADHFGAPVIEVSGRTFPVEVRYRPLVSDSELDSEDLDQTQGICAAVLELVRLGPGDILVFLSGEREIRDTADAVQALDLVGVEVVSLYGRLSAAEQHRVFERHTNRRVVLATNVAETSLTVPGIRYVIDPGTARISRYSRRTKVQRLPIEGISQASAGQRAGRCGRQAAGVCIRLYSEADFLGRPEFTEPEILRTNLASVLLRMEVLGLGELENFPFLQPPDRRSVRDGVALLEELGAFRPAGTGPRLTDSGRLLARLPLDPRLGAMVLAAARNGALAEVLVIAAALSIQDPRERPGERAQGAAEAHARFREPDSDFLAYLNLWRYLVERQRELSSNQFRRLCRAEFLNYLRVREWQDLHAQLCQISGELGWSQNSSAADPDRIHQSLLAGLLSHLGSYDPRRRDYLGARGAHFAVVPDSALFRQARRWVMAGELVETSRLWARFCARIEPEWAESVAAHLVQRSYSEPRWEPVRAAVMAFERVTLFGLPLITRRRVDYARIEPELSRDLFIRQALVAGEWDAPHGFLFRNRQLLAGLAEREDRLRRRDLLVDDEQLVRFYADRIPAEVVSGRHFDAWWKKARRVSPALLDLPPDLGSALGFSAVDPEQYPDSWTSGTAALAASYRFEPGTPEDGVSVRVPLAELGLLREQDVEWLVPGWHEELITQLIRSLPKELRVRFVPAPDTARAVLTALGERAGPAAGALRVAVAAELQRLGGVPIAPGSLHPELLAPYLRLRLEVVDEAGSVIAAGRDLTALQRQLADRIRPELGRLAPELERTGIRHWTLGTLPQRVESERSGRPLVVYPALTDEGESVAVRLYAHPGEQQRAHRLGIVRLLLLTVASPVREVAGGLSTESTLAFARNPHGGIRLLLDDARSAAVGALIDECGTQVWTEPDFIRLHQQVAAALPRRFAVVLRDAERVLRAAAEVDAGLAAATGAALAATRADVATQLAALVAPGFLTQAGADRLPDLVRYLRGAAQRLDRAPRDLLRDRSRSESVQHVTAVYRERLAAVPEEHPERRALEQLRWLIEELRVSYFAQQLGTAVPVSEQRVLRAVQELGG